MVKSSFDGKTTSFEYSEVGFRGRKESHIMSVLDMPFRERHKITSLCHLVTQLLRKTKGNFKDDLRGWKNYYIFA